VGYARRVTTLLGQSGLRLSPRRARQISRGLLGIMALRDGSALEEDFLLVLTWSIPQRAVGQAVLAETIQAAHRIAWEASGAGAAGEWLSDFLSEPTLAGRVARVLSAPDPDTASVGIARYLSSARKEDRAALAFALFPATIDGKIPVGSEGAADLGRLADEVLTVQGTLSWQERHNDSGTQHPGTTAIAQALSGLRAGRRERATQLFHWCLINRIRLPHPKAFEEDFNQAVRKVRDYLRRGQAA
jgi:MoxR-like ATPase